MFAAATTIFARALVANKVPWQASCWRAKHVQDVRTRNPDVPWIEMISTRGWRQPSLYDTSLPVIGV